MLFKCLFCKKDFDVKITLEYHYIDAHEEKKLLNCLRCDGVFGIKKYLIKHLFVVHGVEIKKPHKCSICKKAFCQKDGLKNHTAAVHEEKALKAKEGLMRIKEEKIDSTEIKAEPLDIKEEPLDLKKNL